MGRKTFRLACLLLAWPVLADRQPYVHSTLSWNERAHRIEVVHRLHLHDAQLALGRMQPGASLADLEGRARLALAVEAGFSLMRAHAPLPLTLVGAELRADTLLVYQETAPLPFPGAVEARAGILQDILPGMKSSIISLLP